MSFMNVFRSAHTIDRYFPESSATDLDINPDGTSNSGKAGKSVRMHERVALAPVNEIEKETFLRVYSGDQLYNHPDTISPLDGTELFGDDTAVHWDYGCGRGEYIVDLASRNPDKKYVGVDLHYRSLLLGVRMAADAQLNNVRFIRADAKLLSPFIARLNSVFTKKSFYHHFSGFISLIFSAFKKTIILITSSSLTL